QRDEAEHPVVPTITAQRRTYAGGNRQGERDQQCCEREFHGGGIGLCDHVADILIEAQRASHVAVRQATPVVHVLLPQRSIQPVVMARRRDVGGGRAFAQHLLDGGAADEDCTGDCGCVPSRVTLTTRSPSMAATV